MPLESLPPEARGKAPPTFQRRQRESQVVTKTILQNVKVLAVGRATSRGTYLNVSDSGFATVTVEVSPLDAEKIVFAIDEAARELTLVLRNPADEEEREISPVSWEAID